MLTSSNKSETAVHCCHSLGTQVKLLYRKLRNRENLLEREHRQRLLLFTNAGGIVLEKRFSALCWEISWIWYLFRLRGLVCSQKVSSSAFYIFSRLYNSFVSFAVTNSKLEPYFLSRTKIEIIYIVPVFVVNVLSKTTKFSFSRRLLNTIEMFLGWRRSSLTTFVSP